MTSTTMAPQSRQAEASIAAQLGKAYSCEGNKPFPRVEGLEGHALIAALIDLYQQPVARLLASDNRYGEITPTGMTNSKYNTPPIAFYSLYERGPYYSGNSFNALSFEEVTLFENHVQQVIEILREFPADASPKGRLDFYVQTRHLHYNRARHHVLANILGLNPEEESTHATYVNFKPSGTETMHSVAEVVFGRALEKDAKKVLIVVYGDAATKNFQAGNFQSTYDFNSRGETIQKNSFLDPEFAKRFPGVEFEVLSIPASDQAGNILPPGYHQQLLQDAAQWAEKNNAVVALPHQVSGKAGENDGLQETLIQLVQNNECVVGYADWCTGMGTLDAQRLLQSGIGICMSFGKNQGVGGLVGGYIGAPVQAKDAARYYQHCHQTTGHLPAGLVHYSPDIYAYDPQFQEIPSINELSKVADVAIELKLLGMIMIDNALWPYDNKAQLTMKKLVTQAARATLKEIDYAKIITAEGTEGSPEVTSFALFKDREQQQRLTTPEMKIVYYLLSQNIEYLYHEYKLLLEGLQSISNDDDLESAIEGLWTNAEEVSPQLAAQRRKALQFFTQSSSMPTIDEHVVQSLYNAHVALHTSQPRGNQLRLTVNKKTIAGLVDAIRNCFYNYAQAEETDKVPSSPVYAQINKRLRAGESLESLSEEEQTMYASFVASQGQVQARVHQFERQLAQMISEPPIKWPIREEEKMSEDQETIIFLYQLAMGKYTQDSVRILHKIEFIMMLWPLIEANKEYYLRAAGVTDAPPTPKWWDLYAQALDRLGLVFTQAEGAPRL